jgi:Carboxypeptidase regulatory-like domain
MRAKIRKIQEQNKMKRETQKFITALAAFFLALALCVAVPLRAQVISGDLVGTVLDKTGASVPNATIEATMVSTGVKYETKANETGEYRLNNLPVGVYSVTASAANFASTTVQGFTLELNKTSTLQITLEVKGAVTSIEVSGTAAALDTTTAQVQSTFEAKELADLPSASVGSGVLNLSLLSAGVATAGGVGVGMGPSVGGQRPRNNNFTIEGVDNNRKDVTGATVAIPNDAVAEFSLLQNQFSPEFGHSSGGQFNTVVKSGTNTFHGEAYIYNQNRDYFALDTLQRLEGFDSQPRFDQNRIGGNVGGPVLKNKLFFFVNYEYEPLGQAGGAGAVCAPTADAFATINTYPGLSATNLAQFEKYVAPGTLASNCAPLAWPNPANPTTNISLPTAGLAVVSPSFTNSKFVVASMDYNISNSDQIRGRYIYNSIIGIDNTANLPAFFTTIPAKAHTVAINEYHTFTPTLTNEFRVGYNRFSQTVPDGNFSYPGLDSFPNLQFFDLGQLQLGPDTSSPQAVLFNTYQMADAITWTKRNHTLKFGLEGRKLIAPQSFTQRLRGDYEYSSVLSFLQDQVPTAVAERSNGDAVYYGDQSALYWFANDDWRIRPNLTVNLGLRYEYSTIPFTERLQNLNAESSVPGLIDFSSPRAPKNNWGPRVGIAYSPGSSGRTSIRAGAGMAYDVLFDNLGLLSLPPQLGSTNDCAQVVGPGGFPCPDTGFLASGGLPPGSGGLTVFPDVATARANTSAFIPPNGKAPKSIDWTLGIQHSFLNDYTVEVRYLGTRGIHLPAQIQLNRQPIVTSSQFLPTFTSAPTQAALNALPLDLAALENQSSAVPAYDAAGFGNIITAYEPWSTSTYHGLATQLTKRFSHGFQMVAAYTYSHNIDDATAEVNSTVLSPRRAQDSQDLSADRANSILDHRHRLTITAIYDLPYFKNSNWFLKNGVGNWEFAPIYTYQSGQWATAQSSIDSNLNGDAAPDRTIFNPSGVHGTGTGVTPLCNSSVASCPLSVADARANPAGVVGYLAVNPNAQYITAGYGALANVGRNTLQLAPINDIDITALKRFTVTERFKIEFQAQAFNLFNHPQYVGGLINDVAAFSAVGTIRNALIPGNADGSPNTSFNDPASVLASNARTLQLTLKLFF